MNKNEVLEFLKSNDIWHEVTEHEAVFDMAELSGVRMPYPEFVAKNLFVRDDKKRNYYLITLKGDKKINLKDFRHDHNTRPLSFSSEKELSDILGLTAGSVTPFGILNDKERKVQFYLDNEFSKGSQIIGIHPNDNTATVWLKVPDLIDIVEKHGNNVFSVDML